MNNSKIKIVYMSNSLGPGGAQMMLYRLLARIDREKFQPVVISLLKTEKSLQEKIEALEIKVYVQNFKSSFDFLAYLNLYRLLKELSPNILQTQLFAADILGRIMGRLLKIPVIITSIRNVYYGSSVRYLVFKLTENFASRTVFVSKAAAERFIKMKILPEAKAKVIYNGLDPDLFYSGFNEVAKSKKKALGLPEEGFLLLSVGRLTRQKGYHSLFRALDLMRKTNDNFFLILAGSGPLKHELQAEVEELGLTGKVKFLGYSDNVPALMAAADALVLSSSWEGLPGVVMEAMASELPVVATDVGGTSELVDDGKTGYLVEPANPGDMKEALDKLISLSEEERRTMGKAGREKVKKQFHVEKMTRDYEQLYYETLK